MTHEYFAAFSRSMYSVQARPWHICTILGCAAQSEMPCHGPERPNRSSYLESLALICSTQAGVPSCSCRLSQNLWWDSLLVLCARSIVGGRYDLKAKKKQKQSTQDDMTAEQSRAEQSWPELPAAEQLHTREPEDFVLAQTSQGWILHCTDGLPRLKEMR